MERQKQEEKTHETKNQSLGQRRLRRNGLLAGFLLLENLIDRIHVAQRYVYNCLFACPLPDVNYVRIHFETVQMVDGHFIDR